MFGISWLKVIAFFGVWATIWLPIAFFVSQALDWQPDEPLTPKQKIVFLGSLYILVPEIIGYTIVSGSLSWFELGMQFSPAAFSDIALGLGLSTFGLAAVFSVEFILGSIAWHSSKIPRLFPLLLPILLLSLAISSVEELVFRGYVFITLLDDNSLAVAAIASSLMFALLHLIWERTLTLPQIPGLWLMGIVLVCARIWGDDSLYLPIGLHAGWIWGLTCIDSAELITYQHEHHWLTGINRQPLAGLAGICCLLITCGVVFGLTHSIWSNLV